MLIVKDLADLKRYLKARREMAEKQRVNTKGPVSRNFNGGMVYAFDEAIKTVDALMNHQHREEELE